MKKLICLTFCLLIALFFITPTPSLADENTKTIEGAVIVDGRTLLPLRSIFENLGATVNWNPTSKVVVAEKGNTKIELPLNSKKVKVNGVTKTLDVPAKLIGNKTMVPVRFVSESLGAEVSWNKENQYALIKYQGQQIKVLIQISYLRDTNYIYTYSSQLQTLTDTFKGKENGKNKWMRTIPKLAVGDSGYLFNYEQEDSNGLFIDNYKVLPYPLKEGASWTESGSKFEINSINKTITTKAGTFTNVVEIIKYNYYDPTDKTSYYLSKMYYAPNFGLILFKVSENDTDFELIKLTKK